MLNVNQVVLGNGRGMPMQSLPGVARSAFYEMTYQCVSINKIRKQFTTEGLNWQQITTAPMVLVKCQVAT